MNSRSPTSGSPGASAVVACTLMFLPPMHALTLAVHR
jgi:hypothetical protein